MLIHLRCDNDTQAARVLEELSAVAHDAYVARSFHPNVPAYVVVETEDKQVAAMLQELGGRVYDLKPVEPAEDTAEELEEETVPDDEQSTEPR